MRRAHPDKTVEVWAEDEARLGLKPVVRRVWARKGQRPIAPHRTRYQWLYLHCFVEPATGETSWLLLPSVRGDLTTLALRAFAGEHDPENRKILVLLLDRAGYHSAADIAVPSDVRLHFLPSYTPELQPVECVWPLVREAMANTVFPDLDALEATLIRRCRWLLRHPEIVRGRAGFRWIRRIAKRQESG